MQRLTARLRVGPAAQPTLFRFAARHASTLFTHTTLARLPRCCPRPPAAAAAPRLLLARRLLSTRTKDPYQVLGVGRSATEKEIKAAYFRAAKKSHPDVDKSAGAAERFRDVSEAYDVLRDPGRRRAADAGDYSDSSGSSSSSSSSSSYGGGGGAAGGGSRGGGGGGASGYRRQRGWEDEMFRSVWSELGMADVDAYIDRVGIELNTAVSQAVSGNTAPAWAFAREHRALLVGTIVPITLLFRSPTASVFVLRLLGPAYALGRYLPPRMQWRIFSRLWVGSIIYLERVGTRLVDATSSAARSGGTPKDDDGKRNWGGGNKPKDDGGKRNWGGGKRT